MTDKRFTLEMQYWKGNPQGRKLFDNLTGQEGMSVEELCNIASALHSKCEELESVLEVYEDSLNKLEKENKELEEELQKWKDKYYDAETTVIFEYSSTIAEDMEKLSKEVYGDYE